MFYIWTLDSHDCIGPFPTQDAAHAYAKRHGYTSYMLCDCPPFEYTIPHPPMEHAP